MVPNHHQTTNKPGKAGQARPVREDSPDRVGVVVHLLGSSDRRANKYPKDVGVLGLHCAFEIPRNIPGIFVRSAHHTSHKLDKTAQAGQLVRNWSASLHFAKSRRRDSGRHSIVVQSEREPGRTVQVRHAPKAFKFQGSGGLRLQDAGRSASQPASEERKARQHASLVFLLTGCPSPKSHENMPRLEMSL